MIELFLNECPLPWSILKEKFNRDHQNMIMQKGFCCYFLKKCFHFNFCYVLHLFNIFILQNYAPHCGLFSCGLKTRCGCIDPLFLFQIQAAMVKILGKILKKENLGNQLPFKHTTKRFVLMMKLSSEMLFGIFGMKKT